MIYKKMSGTQRRIFFSFVLGWTSNKDVFLYELTRIKIERLYLFKAYFADIEGLHNFWQDIYRIALKKP